MELTNRAVIDDPASIGVGPVALVRLAYADSSDESTMTVPEVLVGRRRGTHWTTTVGNAPRGRRLRFLQSRPDHCSLRDPLSAGNDHVS